MFQRTSDKEQRECKQKKMKRQEENRINICSAEVVELLLLQNNRPNSICCQPICRDTRKMLESTEGWKASHLQRRKSTC